MSKTYYNIYKDSSGSVGIGTTSPGSKLDVASGEVRISSGNGPTTHLNYLNNGLNYISMADNQGTFIRSTSAARMVILGGGNVGVGTSSPDSRFHVVNNDFVLFENTTASANSLLKLKTASRTWQMSVRESDLSGALTFRNETAGTDDLVINTSGNVGIGTTSPNAKLEISGDTRSGGRILYGGTESNYLTGVSYASIYGTADTFESVSGLFGSLVLQSRSNTDRPIIFVTGATPSEKMRLSSSGSLGIGTASPSGKLDLVGNLIINGASNSNVAQQVFTRTDVSWGIFNETNLRFYSSNSNTTSPSTLRFQIDSSGNVGIGAPSPGSKLTISDGDIKLQGSRSGDADIQSIIWHNTNSSGFDVAKIVGKTGTNIYEGIIGFETKDSGGTMAERMRITSAGQLQVTGNGVISNHESGGNFSYLQQTSSDARLYVQYSQPLLFGTAATERMRIDANGNVGIGTTSPSNKLYVVGESTFAGKVNILTASTDGILRLGGGDGSSGTNNRVQMSFGYNGTLTYEHYIVTRHNAGTSDYNAFDFYTNDGTSSGTYPTNAVHNLTLNGGKVGIGTTSPGTLLHVYQDSASSLEVLFENDGTGQVGLTLRTDRNSDGNLAGFINFDANDDGGNNTRYATIESFIVDNTDTTEDGRLTFSTFVAGTDTETMHITGGNVGIGTTSPSAPLEIAGAASATDTGITIKNGSATRLRLFHNDNAGTSYLTSYDGVGAAQALSIRSGNKLYMSGGGGSTHVTVDTSGNVGIGTTSPSGKLHIFNNSSGATAISQQQLIVENNSATGIGILTPSTTSGYLFFGDNNDAQRGYITYNHSSDEMKFKVAGSERVFINSSGNVGIGTASPVSKLHVSASASGDAANLLLTNTNDTNGDTASIQFSTTDSALYNKAAIYFERTDLQGEGSLHLATSNTGNSTSVTKSDARLTITKDGNVGIGTTSPSEKLHIKRSSGTGCFVRFEDTGGSGVYIGGRSNRMELYAGGVERIRIASNGQIRFNTYGSGTFTGTTAKVLAVDSSGNIIETNSGSGSVTSSSSTTNYLTKWTNGGSEILGNSIAYDDGTNIGIGTTSPNEKLDVNGFIKSSTYGFYAGRTDSNGTSFGSGVPTILLRGSSSNASYSARAGALWFKRYDGTDTAALYSTDGTDGYGLVMAAYQGDIKFATSTLNGYKMTILSGGSVGIGTTSPSSKLDVNGSAAFGSAATRLTTYSDVSYSGIYNGSSLYTDEAFYFGTGKIYFIADGSERMRLTTTGLGIGTTSPSAKLDIRGTGADGTELLRIESDGDVADGGYHWMTSEMASSQSTNANIVHLIGVAESTKNSAYIGFHYAGAGSNSNYLTLGGYAANNLLIIKMDGNVGIGTTSPSAPLHSTGTIRVGSSPFTDYKAAQQYSSSNYEVALASGTFKISDGNNDAKLAVVISTGNVGIGTTSPDYKLDVRDSSAATRIVVRNENNAAGGAGIYLRTFNGGTQVSNATIRTNNSGSLGIFTGTSGEAERLTINSSGNVGIGTTSPTDKLHVVGNLKIAGNINPAADATYSIGTSSLRWLATYTARLLAGDGSASAPGITFINDTNTGLFRSTNDTLNISVGGTEIAYFVSSGFYIANNINGLLYEPVEGGVAGGRYYLMFDYTNNASYPFLTNRTPSGKVVIKTGTAAGGGENTHFTIEGGDGTVDAYFENANVGIGTTSPATALHVSGSALANTLYAGSSTSAAIVIDSSTIYRPNSFFQIIGGGSQSTRNNIKFTNGAGLVIDGGSGETSGVEIKGGGGDVKFTQGNVGIGTTSPGYKLEVNGSFAATTKSFVIDHPTKEGKRLVYASLEGPENGVYVRGRGDSDVIELPDYWVGLVHEDSITVQITAKGKDENNKIRKYSVNDIVDNKVYIYTDSGDNIYSYFYIVHAERKDVDKLQVEID